MNGSTQSIGWYGSVAIKMDFINPESAEKFVEKGWDEEKQMYYYLVYFNKEEKK